MGSSVVSMQAAYPGGRGANDLSEALDEQAVAETAVADRERRGVEAVERRADDARAGEDHVGAARLQPDDRASLRGVDPSVPLDLRVDLAAVEHGAVDDVRVGLGQPMPARGQIGDGPADGGDGVRRRMAGELLELVADRRDRGVDGALVDGVRESEPFADADRADVDAEL